MTNAQRSGKFSGTYIDDQQTVLTWKCPLPPSPKSLYFDITVSDYEKRFAQRNDS
jgi:hypothetical protein